MVQLKALIARLSGHFKVPKPALKSDIEYYCNQQVMAFTVLRDSFAFNHKFMLSQRVVKTNLKKLVSLAEFKASYWYDDFLLGVGSLPPDQVSRFVLVVKLGCTLWVIRRTGAYDGVGGIWLRDCRNKQLSGGGFTIEPMTHWLNYAYPSENTPVGISG